MNTSQSQGFTTLANKVKDQLDRLAALDQKRSLSPRSPHNEETMDLLSNDYLGLQENLAFQKACHQAIEALPVGAGASRLLGGEYPVFSELETAFARFQDAESALYFTSGYAANEGVITSLARNGCAFFSDQLNHASIIDGVRLSGISKDALHIFPHRDYESLGKLLAASQAEVNLILVEGLYSMDGSYADLWQIAELAAHYRGVMVVDEAHSLGVRGPYGNGYGRELGLGKELITINPCGKGMAAAGAVVTGPGWLKELLVNTARPFIFSTGSSPWVAKALQVSLQFVQSMNEERQHLKTIASFLRSELQQMGYDTGVSESHIIPVILGDNAKALAAATHLGEAGIVVKAIRPPTVAPGTARLRLSLRANLTQEHCDHLVAAFHALKKVLR